MTNRTSQPGNAGHPLGESKSAEIPVGGGVYLTQAEIAASQRHKAAGRYIKVSQTPSFRDAVSLSHIIMLATERCPRKLRVVADNLDQMSNSLLCNISIAFEDEHARKDALTDSLAVVKTIYVKLSYLQKLASMPKEDRRLLDGKVRSLIAQLAAWRNSVKGQRHVKNAEA